MDDVVVLKNNMIDIKEYSLLEVKENLYNLEDAFINAYKFISDFVEGAFEQDYKENMDYIWNIFEKVFVNLKILCCKSFSDEEVNYSLKCFYLRYVRMFFKYTNKYFVKLEFCKKHEVLEKLGSDFLNFLNDFIDLGDDIFGNDKNQFRKLYLRSKKDIDDIKSNGTYSVNYGGIYRVRK